MELLFPELDNTKKIKKVRKFKNQDIEICTRFMDEYYIPKYTEYFGIPPRINWGKDLKLLKIIIKDYKDISIFSCETYYELFTKVCELFFVDNSNYVLKNSWNIQAYYYMFQSLVLKIKHNEDNCITPIIEGYKIAYWNYYNEKYDKVILNQDIFSQIYIYIKSLKEKYGKDFTFKRFSELFFLVGFNYMGKRDYNINFFISNLAKNLFDTWITESNLLFYPKNDGIVDQKRFDEALQLEKLEFTI